MKKKRVLAPKYGPSEVGGNWWLGKTAGSHSTGPAVSARIHDILTSRVGGKSLLPRQGGKGDDAACRIKEGGRAAWAGYLLERRHEMNTQMRRRGSARNQPPWGHRKTA